MDDTWFLSTVPYWLSDKLCRCGACFLSSIFSLWSKASYFCTPPVFNATFGTKPLRFRNDILAWENMNDGIPGGYESLMMCLVVSTQCAGVTDGQTDGWTEVASTCRFHKWPDWPQLTTTVVFAVVFSLVICETCKNTQAAGGGALHCWCWRMRWSEKCERRSDPFAEFQGPWAVFAEKFRTQTDCGP